MPRLSKIGAAALGAFGWTSGSSISASYLIVSGGGSGAQTGGNNYYKMGGGGAGGLVTGTITLSTASSYTVVVGGGGAINNNTYGGLGGYPGGNSSLSAVSTTVLGGGGGLSPGENGPSSGYGSGGGASASSFNNNNTYTGTAGTAGQGYAGGNATMTSSTGANLQSGAGGGGAGGAGANGGTGSSPAGGAGGVGVASSISGTSTYYAGGGGGGSAGGGGGAGGNGGGGAGGNSGYGVSATQNTGGGGGGGAQSGGTVSGQGGSGIVIISYLGAQQFGGGVVTSSGGYTIHTFNSSGTLSPLSSLTASYLIVAGGGGGGGDFGGGGGAGGLLSGSGVTIDTNSTYLVTVGAGGSGSLSSANRTGSQGSNSAFSMVTTTAIGGGYGNYATNTAGNGGSGGGTATGGTAGTGTSGQGNAGGVGFNSGTNYAGGGGGGAGATGGNGSGTTGGNGGNGLASSISGVSTYYAGGGGGYGGNESGSGAATAGTGGLGGGGNGGKNNQNETSPVAATSGTANSGGGGGGPSNRSVAYPGGSGGSGVVIISYPGSVQQMAGGTVTISGGNVIHTFTNSGYLAPLKLVNNSLRFRSSNSANLTRQPTVSGSQTTATYSFWMKRGKLSVASPFHTTKISSAGTNATVLQYNSSDQLNLLFASTGGTNYINSSTAVYRDPAAWYHVVVAVDTTQANSTDRLKAYVNGVQITSWATSNVPPQSTNLTLSLNTLPMNIGTDPRDGTYYDGEMTEINFIDGQALTPNAFGTFNSYGVWQPITYGGSYGTNGFYLPFGSGSSSYAASFNGSSQKLLTSTSSSLALGTNDFTVEYWVYFNNRSASQEVLTAGNGTNTYDGIFGLYDTSGLLALYLSSNNSSWDITGGSAIGTLAINTWNHVAITRSGTTFYAFLNGQGGQIFTNSSSIYQSANSISIGSGQSGNYVNGYLSNVRVVVGTAIYTKPFVPSTTALTAVTNTKLLTLQNATIVDNSSNALTFTNTGTVATTVQYPFLANSTRDQSPAGNNWTPNNIGFLTGSSFDSMTDVPTLTSATAANYATFNPLSLSSTTLSNGNLLMTKTGSADVSVVSTIAMTTGKFYWEQTVVTLSASSNLNLGIVIASAVNNGNFVSNSSVYFNGNGNVYRLGTSLGVVGTTYAVNDVIGLAFDADNGTLALYKNNTLIYTVTSIPANTYTTFTDSYANGEAISVNFGQQPFKYTPPTGFVALNTYNI